MHRGISKDGVFMMRRSGSTAQWGPEEQPLLEAHDRGRGTRRHHHRVVSHSLVAGAAAVSGFILGVEIHESTAPISATSPVAVTATTTMTAISTIMTPGPTVTMTVEPTAKVTSVEPQPPEAQNQAKPVQPPAPATQPAQQVYYKNCAEVRAAGMAPILAGQPGYRSALDRDGDGVACE